ncbi:hypothetical protein [Nannocystis pusilla]|uniref:hypothetical protein n=1 Tax=Nannocystis pusilla TaxID=889268 RepID=UPI003B8071C9
MRTRLLVSTLALTAFVAAPACGATTRPALSSSRSRSAPTSTAASSLSPTSPSSSTSTQPAAPRAT